MIGPTSDQTVTRIIATLMLLMAAASCSRAAQMDISRLKLPPGFNIRVFATVPRARMMTFTPGGTLLVSETAEGKIVALPDPQHTGRAQRVATVLSGLNLPHGLAFHEGKLYVAETDAVSRYDWNETALRASAPHRIAELPGAGMHFTRTILFSNGKLYVSIGSDCNVCVEEDPKRASVLEMNPDGSGARVFARGLRNAVGLALNPTTGTVWVTDNGRDDLGDDLPPDEIDDLGHAGGDFGWPYCYGKRIPDPAHKAEGERHCPSTIPPLVELQAHSAPLGLAFSPGVVQKMSFPPQYRNNLFVAYHGSWNRSVPTGYKVVRIWLQGRVEDFITGWLPGHNRRQAMGRPVDVIFERDGAMYISDDDAGVVYRVTYMAK